MSATVSPAPVVRPPALEPERPVEWPRRTVRTLSNGLQVVLAESHGFPKMSAQLFIRSGNAAVALESPGLADITADVVRTGTGSRDQHRVEQDLRRMGADLATSAGADSSAISVAGLAEFATPILELIVDLAQHATLPVAQFERERRQKLEELKIERTTPSFLAGERMRRVLFGAHPYAVVAPTEEQVNAYRLEDLERFYRRHYVPTGSLLIAVGDFASGRLMDEIERIFGSWKAPEPPAPEWPAPPEIHGRHVHFVHLPGTVQTEVLIGNRAITRRDPDWMRLTLANSIYGGAFNSRLVRNIREEKGYTYSPRSTAHALRHRGYFTVHAAVRNDVVAASLTEMFYEIDRMRSVSVGEDELADARNYMSGVFSLGVATQDGLLGQLAILYLERLAEDYLEKYRERIRGMTAADVLAAARKYFDSANTQITVVGDREQIAAQAALFGDVDYYDAQGNRL
jgi:zinc protease